MIVLWIQRCHTFSLGHHHQAPGASCGILYILVLSLVLLCNPYIPFLIYEIFHLLVYTMYNNAVVYVATLHAHCASAARQRQVAPSASLLRYCRERAGTRCILCLRTAHTDHYRRQDQERINQTRARNSLASVLRGRRISNIDV